MYVYIEMDRYVCAREGLRERESWERYERERGEKRGVYDVYKFVYKFVCELSSILFFTFLYIYKRNIGSTKI